MLWIPEKSLGGGGGDSGFLAKASGSKLMRLNNHYKRTSSGKESHGCYTFFCHIGVIACPSNCCGTHKFISLCDVENLNVACGLILTKHAFLRVGYCLFRLLAVTMSHVWKLLCFCRWL